ncbi:MAG: NUDIX hydrolase [archaeon]
MIRVHLAGGVIVNPRKEVLLVLNHKTNSWTYPKGHVGDGEDFLDAAKREIKEESGLGGLELVCELPVYERPTRQNPNKIKVMHMFLFRAGDVAAKSDSSEISEIRWVPPDEVSAYFSYPEEADFFNRIRDQIARL